MEVKKSIGCKEEKKENEKQQINENTTLTWN